VTDSSTRPKLLVGTTSAGKLREFLQLLAPLPATILTPSDLGLDLEVEEGETSFLENAVIKARAYQQASGLLTLAEDSGFEVDALGGEPGVISARWGGTDYEVKNRLIADRVAGQPPEQRGCRYISVLAILTPAGRLYRRTGTCRGRVADGPRGTNGFGYDPIFYVPRLHRTMAELDGAEKDRISHRGQAVRRAWSLLERLVAEAAGTTEP
jgi:XTP/dITP diphosphohydrolase